MQAPFLLRAGSEAGYTSPVSGAEEGVAEMFAFLECVGGGHDQQGGKRLRW